MLKTIDNLNYSKIILLYISALFIYLLIMPISFSDTDLWYHMTGGQFFWENNKVPDTSFFSFITPEKQWINYFWGFQATVFILHDNFGYQGLIVFKATLISASCYIIFLIFTNNKKINITSFQAALILCVIFIISIRSTMVRPHLISYLLIPTFIYVLSSNKKLIPLLPLLTILWVNMHGVEWPVGALICGSYLATIVWNYKKSRDNSELKYIKWILLCIPAMFLNPFTYQILAAPFSTPSEIYKFIVELIPTHEYLSNLLHTKTAQHHAIFIIGLIIFTLMSLISLGRKKSLQPHHILLTLGAYLLLIRGYRFVWEWLLLSIPLLTHASHINLKQLPLKESRFLPGAIVLSIFTLPIYTWFNNYNIDAQYPINSPSLPFDSVNYIKDKNLTGKIISTSTLTGFLEWELGKKLKVHSDMEFPPFNELDFFESKQSLQNEYALQHMMNKYNPEVILVPNTHKNFSQLAKQSEQLTPVFFDDHSVVYINKKSYLELSQSDQIAHLIPDNKSTKNEDSTTIKLNDFKKISNKLNHSPITLLNYANLLSEQQNYEQAITISNRALSISPQDGYSYASLAKSYFKLGQYNLAIENYHLALDYDFKDLRDSLNNELAECYFYIDDYENSYKYFKKSFNPYIRNEEIGHFIQFAISSIITKDIENAKRLVKMIHIIDDGKHTESIHQLIQLLAANQN